MNTHPTLAPAAFLLALTALLTGCANFSLNRSADDSGYYGGDRPPEKLPIDPDSVPDAVPRRERLSETGNHPYTALGKRYRPLVSAKGYVKRGQASWYGQKFHGRRTSSGERYDMFAMTAAHPILPLPTYVRVRNLDNGKSVVVKVNDRGPFLHGRIIDLSYMAAHKLDIASHGTGRVEVRAIDLGGEVGSDEVGKLVADGEVVIQIGAYAVRDNARSMHDLLQRAGYRVAPLLESQQGDEAGWLYRVRVGPFANLADAQSARQKLESLLGRAVAIAQW